MQLTESGFENYRCDSNQVLGIKFAALDKILKCMTNKDSLSIQAQDDGDIINFIFESQDQKRYSNFELKLNDIGAGSMMIKGMISGGGGGKVKDEDATQMDEEDEDMQMAVPTQNVDDDGDAEDNGVRIQLEESVQQTFSLRYLNNFTKATGLSKEVVLRMGAEVPLEVEYKIADFGSLRYYLAPKIDDDE